MEAHAETTKFKTPIAPWKSEIQILRELRRRNGQNLSIKQPNLKVKASSKAAFKNLDLLTIENSKPAVHPQSPRIVAVDVTSNGYRVALGDLLGGLDTVVIEQLPQSSIEWLQRVSTHLKRIASDHAQQILGVVVSVPSTVIENRYAAPAFSGWGIVDFEPLKSTFSELPFHIESSARLAGLIESAQAQSVSGVTHQVCLYIDLNSHISGSLTVNGNTVQGNIGSAGEFGHMPFGNSTLPCICGASGCWGTAVSGIGLADFLNEAQPTDPARYLADMIRTCEEAEVDYTGNHGFTSAEQRRERYMRGISHNAQLLGQGIAALTNALAPDTIILGSLAAQLHRAASQSFDAAYTSGLMNSRKAAQPAIMYSRSSGDAALRGAIELGMNEILTPQWFEDRVKNKLLAKN